MKITMLKEKSIKVATKLKSAGILASMNDFEHWFFSPFFQNLGSSVKIVKFK